MSEVRFPVTEETRKAMERFWELSGRCSISEVFSRCLNFYLEKKDPVREEGKTEKLQKVTHENHSALPAKLEPGSRYISRSVKREVRRRSGEQCEYVDPTTQRRCESRYLLEYDHRVPFASGGTSEESNIRMLCALHNSYLGKEMLKVGRLKGRQGN